MTDVDAAPPSDLPPPETTHDAPSPSQDAPSPSQDAPTTQDENSTSLITTNAAGKKVRKIIRKKRRPARAQVESTFQHTEAPQTGTIYNVWYNKWSGGDREDKYLSKTAAPSRCNISKDSGYTRADKVQGSYFCLFFARGICPRGQDCEYLHRLPTIHDHFNPNVDCFGRDKFSDYRDDMGGVGSFLRQNRTLYVGRIHVTDDIEEIVARHFAEWGQVDRIRVLTARGVGFVTYSNEANAQFAKEAMAHQALDNSEILNVRWATMDPNPAAQKREAFRVEEQAAEAIRRALPAEYVAELEGRSVEDVKRRRLQDGGFGNGAANRQQIEGMEEQLLLQAADAQQGQDLEDEQRLMIEQAEAQDEPANFTQNGGGGIIGGSTLAALRGYNAGNGVKVSTKQSAAPAGPLVGYGSDSDDE